MFALAREFAKEKMLPHAAAWEEDKVCVWVDRGGGSFCLPREPPRPHHTHSHTQSRLVLLVCTSQPAADSSRQQQQNPTAQQSCQARTRALQQMGMIPYQCRHSCCTSQHS